MKLVLAAAALLIGLPSPAAADEELIMTVTWTKTTPAHVTWACTAASPVVPTWFVTIDQCTLRVGAQVHHVVVDGVATPGVATATGGVDMTFGGDLGVCGTATATTPYGQITRTRCG